MILLVSFALWKTDVPDAGNERHHAAVEPPSRSPRKESGGQLEYVPDVGRSVAVFVQRDDFSGFFFGHLDARGNFLRDARRRVEGMALSGAAPVPEPGTIINFSAFEGEPVYEYRSGYLIRGVLKTLGDGFIPDLGGQVIAFKDYRPGKGVPRIYNLPGSFVKRKK